MRFLYFAVFLTSFQRQHLGRFSPKGQWKFWFCVQTCHGWSIVLWIQVSTKFPCNFDFHLDARKSQSSGRLCQWFVALTRVCCCSELEQLLQSDENLKPLMASLHRQYKEICLREATEQELRSDLKTVWDNFSNKRRLDINVRFSRQRPTVPLMLWWISRWHDRPVLPLLAKYAVLPSKTSWCCLCIYLLYFN